MIFRILYICDYSAIYSGNFIKSLIKLRDELQSRSVDFMFTFPLQAKDREWIKSFKDEEIHFINLHGKKISILLAIRALITDWNPTIVHTHFCSPNYLKFLTYLFPSIRFIVHDNSDFSSQDKSIKRKVKNYITYKILAKRIVFICVSKKILNRYSKNAVYIPNGIVVHERFVTERNRLREMLGIMDNDVLCELFGWSPYVKGVDVGVEAIKIANMISKKNIKLLIVYGKNMSENNIKEYIRAKTSCSGNEKFILFVPPTEDVFAYHEASDILLSTSRSEGFSYSILEMLSIGKRCVISKIPGTMWAEEYNSIEVFKTEDTQDCANAIIRSINKKTYSNEVEKKVNKDYSIDKWINSQLIVYGILDE